jgi:hypothetical protein
VHLVGHCTVSLKTRSKCNTSLSNPDLTENNYIAILTHAPASLYDFMAPIPMTEVGSWWRHLSTVTKQFGTAKPNTYIPDEGREFLLICEGIIYNYIQFNYAQWNTNTDCNVNVHSIRSLVSVFSARQVHVHIKVSLLRCQHTSGWLRRWVYQWQYMAVRYNWRQGQTDRKYRVPREHF